MRSSVLFFGTVWFAVSVGLTRAAEPARPVVAGYERFHTGDKAGTSRGGELLLGELNCVSCHQAGDAGRKPAPILDGVGNRVRLGHLRKFLRDPHAVMPGTTMPALFVGDPARDEKVEALVHYLASTGSIKQARPEPKRVATGRDLYNRVGCVACHGSRDATGNAEKTLATSVPLGDLKSKYTIASLTGFLENPHTVRPGGRMPKLLNNKEAGDVANYLLQGLAVDFSAGKGATNYAYFEGTWDKLPEFDKLKPTTKGKGAGFDVGVARRESNYGIRFDGVFKIDREGTYTFTLHSDDGSRLLIDNKVVVNNDGVHAPQAVTGSTKLSAGVHTVVVLFFQGGGGAELEVTIDGPGFGSHRLGDLVAVSEEALAKKPEPKKPDEDVLDLKPALVETGRALFTSAGCASCHQMQERGKPLASSFTAPALDKLKGEGGCLAEKPGAGVPVYHLDGGQRKALAAAITTPPHRVRNTAQVLTRVMTTFNCYACHDRDKIGGPEEDLKRFFQTTQPEMGDEGRIPPSLDGAGAKLQPDYFKLLLDQGVHDRPYMHTRMPGFGHANVGQLIEVFAAVDKVEKASDVEFKESVGRIKTHARFLVGDQAFGCVKCHTFNGQKAEGVQGIDMTLMPRKLKRDWFHAYMADPQKFRPGTRMPTPFVDGVSQIKTLLDGQAAPQTEAIWQYLSDGIRARAPIGTYAKSIPLVPTEGAILYRNFIEGSGTRAIAVGYPEKAHLAFDANEMRITMLWQGAFIDAARHWTDRGSGFEGPLGDNVLRLHSGAPFAVLVKETDAWPGGTPKTLGYRFLGYRTTPDDRPTFLYAMGDVRIEDFPQPVGGKEPKMRRTLTITAAKPVEGLYFRAVVGNKIESTGNGSYRIDGAWTMKLEGTKPLVRTSGGKSEMLVPILFSDGKARIVQEFEW